MHERIRKLRLELKLSQTEFGSKVGLSQNYIWMIEKGERTPSDRTISDICRIFGVSLAWLQYGEGEMYVRRSANEELTMLLTDLMSETDESFRKRFISAMLDLPPEFWPEFEKFLKKITGNT